MAGAGELSLIAAFEELLRPRSDRVVRWVGDDAAVVRARPFVVTSVDAMVDGVHFRLNHPGGIQTRYCHMNQMAVGPGQGGVSLEVPQPASSGGVEDVDDEDEGVGAGDPGVGPTVGGGRFPGAAVGRRAVRQLVVVVLVGHAVPAEDRATGAAIELDRGHARCVAREREREGGRMRVNLRALVAKLKSEGFTVFGAENADKALKVLAENNMGSSVYSTAVPANGVLFITNRNQLFALAESK